MTIEEKKIIYKYSGVSTFDADGILTLMNKMVEKRHWYSFCAFVNEQWGLQESAMMYAWLFSKDGEDYRFFKLFIESGVWKKE
jgi:hypothetical protein